jgi:hypothetical protein
MVVAGAVDSAFDGAVGNREAGIGFFQVNSDFCSTDFFLGQFSGKVSSRVRQLIDFFCDGMQKYFSHIAPAGFAQKVTFRRFCCALEHNTLFAGFGPFSFFKLFRIQIDEIVFPGNSNWAKLPFLLRHGPSF